MKCWGLLLALLCGAAQANEHILDFNSDIVIAADGAMQVTETIWVRAEGQRINHGIYRDFPTRYTDGHGRPVTVEFTLLDAQRDGEPEQNHIESLSNGVRVYLGSRSSVVTAGEHRYRIRYRTSRQLGFFPKADELYWNVTGNGWEFPIGHASATVQLPRPVAPESLAQEAYTGPQGAKGQDWKTSGVTAGRASFETTRALGAHEGFTIVLSFPKGVVKQSFGAPEESFNTEPGHSALGYSSSSIWIRNGVPPLLLIVLCLIGWRVFGYRGNAGPLFPRYEAPKDYSPGALRYLMRGKHDARCMTADIAYLAARGVISIFYREEHQGFWKAMVAGKPSPWQLEHRQNRDDMTPGESAIVGDLFAVKGSISVGRGDAAQIREALKAHAESCKRQFAGTHVQGTFVFMLIVTALAVIAAIVLDAMFSLLLAIPIWLVLMPMMHFYTPRARALLDEIYGLRLYLSVAEKDDLARERAPPLDAARFQALLPFAIALDVEQAWTGKLTAAIGEAAMKEVVRNVEYYGDDGFRLGAFAGAIASTAAAAAASSSSDAPGSSSGSDGGGSSGGGGGGGGGGGW